jgi:tetratricopeptide (TPR) repeat protein
MTRKRLGLIVLAVLCVVLAYRGYEELEERKQQKAAAERTRAVMLEIQDERELEGRLPQDDRDMRGIPSAYPRPVSAWQTAEKGFYERMLAKGRFDTLVVPFQVQDHAFARDIRSLMTAELALSIGAAGKAVPDPYLVGRALGDGKRRFDLVEVFRMANALEVRRVIVGYVGHNDKNEMRLTLHYYDRAPKERLGPEHAPTKGKYVMMRASQKVRARHFEKLAFSAVDTPIDVFYRTLPGMLEFLGLDAKPAQAASSFEAGVIPSSPLGMVSNASEPARDAYYFQLLAALTPQSAERVRERFIEKSMLAVRRLSADSADYRALKARSLMRMGLRPAALQALGTPATGEEKHLFAVLNGNLPDVQAARPLVAPGVRSLIATLEENEMAGAYGVRTQKAALAQAGVLKLPGDVWQVLVARALTDWELWTQHENIFVKALLDQEFPIEGSSAQAMLQGASVVGAVTKLRNAGDLSVIDHVRRHFEGQAAKWCCDPLVARPNAWDYLQLIEAIGTDNLVRRGRFLVQTQGRPEDAVQFLARIDSVYKDHPQFVLVMARAQVALAKNAQGAEQEGLRRAAYASTFNVYYWEEGQTRTADDALDQLLYRNQRRDFGGYPRDVYANDYPYRPFYTVAGSRELWMAALQNSAFEFDPVDRLEWSLGRVKKQWHEFDEVLKSLEHRFVGHPRRVKMMAQASLRRDDFAATEKLYREGIRSQPQDEELYTQLGKLLFESGQAQQAADVFTSYPGLKKRSEFHPVGVANYAYEAGSLYYWMGDFKRALPLYRTAAELETGSDSSIASRARLQLIEGDFVGALRGSHERARRYNSMHAYRDYFGLLHAMGQSQQAWDGFKATVTVDAPYLWETALVGHRREGASEEQVAAWVSQEPMRSAGNRHPYAAMYLLRAGLIDRTPSAQLAQRIAAVERPVWQLDNKYRNVIRQSKAGDQHQPLGPRSGDDGDGYIPANLGATKKSPVKSDYVYMAEAYRAMRSGQFEAARAALQEAATFYDMRTQLLGYLLPYYAFASMRAKDTAAVEGLLADVPMELRRFDYYLAKVVLAAGAGKHDEASRYASLALHRRAFTNNRPIYTEYEYAEICEWLFEATREPRYRAMALEWVRKNQAFQPWFAWSYAIEAKLSPNPQERRRAMAMTYYLDRNSERLSRLPQGEVKAAAKEYAARNPFARPALERSKEKA